MSQRTIDDLLTDRHQRFSPLQKLLHQAAARDAWTRELRAVLPDELQNHFAVAALQGTVLVVLCASASSATRLRFMAPDIVGRLKSLAHFRHLETLSLRVADDLMVKQAPADC